jgi:hypothetical protein
VAQKQNVRLGQLDATGDAGIKGLIARSTGMKGVGGRVFENCHDLSFLAIGSRFGGGDRSFHSFHECCGLHLIRSLTSLH